MKIEFNRKKMAAGFAVGCTILLGVVAHMPPAQTTAACMHACKLATEVFIDEK